MGMTKSPGCRPAAARGLTTVGSSCESAWAAGAAVRRAAGVDFMKPFRPKFKNNT
jgi:hypothetical protein